MHSNYDKTPIVYADPEYCSECWAGWETIVDKLNNVIAQQTLLKPDLVVAFEYYTGIYEDEIKYQLEQIKHNQQFDTFAAFRSVKEIDGLVSPYNGGDDPIFGYMSPLTLDQFLDPDSAQTLRKRISKSAGITIVRGTGALLVCEPDLIIYLDMPRWEGQLRQRRGEVSNLGAENKGLKGSLQYKRSFFIDWRVCDRLKSDTIKKWDFFLDTTIADSPKLLTGNALLHTLSLVVQQPFRVVPYFDTAPWGGQWLKETCDLDRSLANYGWGFDCVPEENSLLLKFENAIVEIPAQTLVIANGQELLGDSIFGLFGPEFPIRFDFLDTVKGGNLSLQVHPLVTYAQENFGIHYTQDESYYILDAMNGATVYLGMKNGADIESLFSAIELAQQSGADLDTAKFVNKWPAKKHDHFLIPAGTVHCSGAEAVVLEISATPYIFTFKLWDWNRMGLDGNPRPINLTHGRRVIQENRDTDWTKDQLVNKTEIIRTGPGWREERTGLHSLEFIETRRHWFTEVVEHDTNGTVNVLNLVEGAEAIVESPLNSFQPFLVHYAETFIVPANIGKYTIRPYGKSAAVECATIKAFVRFAGIP